MLRTMHYIKPIASALARSKMTRVKHLLSAFWLSLFGLSLGPAAAHDFRIGALRIDHPYATPSPPGLKTGGVFFRSISNNGDTPDRLLSATSSRAGSIEIHRMQMEGNIMRMRAMDALDLPARSEVPMRHGSANGYHLMLLNLSSPLKDGDEFSVTLQFERAGKREVSVKVQTPKDNPRNQAGHQH